MEKDSHTPQLPNKPTFEQKGLKGYKYPLDNKDVEINIVDVTQGHDTYIISQICTHMYYVLEGSGSFDIGGKVHKVKKGSFIVVRPQAEYTYSGKMKLLLIMNPPWTEGNEKVTKKNPD